MRTPVARLIAILLLTGFLAGCGKTITHKVSDGIKAALPGVVGPADSWDVAVSGNQGTIMGGRIPRVVIHGVNVKISPLVTMSAVDIDARNIRIDVNRRMVKSVDSLTFMGTMTQSNVDDYMRLSAPLDPTRPPDFRVTLRAADLQVTFKKKELALNVAVVVTGQLAVSTTGNDRLDFVPSHASVAKVPMPRNAIRYEMRGVNPVIDLSSLSIPIHIRDVHIDKHTATFYGIAAIPASAVIAAQKATYGQ